MVLRNIFHKHLTGKIFFSSVCQQIDTEKRITLTQPLLHGLIHGPNLGLQGDPANDKNHGGLSERLITAPHHPQCIESQFSPVPGTGDK